GGRLTSAIGQVGPAPLAVAAVGAAVTALGSLIGALGTRPLYAKPAGDRGGQLPAAE
ncbi:MAG: hypothetical protein HOV79_30965, partial [Hamadaea sp.]|nr:hypothetical protein [Hamadaea sp.]